MVFDLAGSFLVAACVCGLLPFPSAPPEEPGSTVPVTPVGSGRCDSIPFQLLFSRVTKTAASAQGDIHVCAGQVGVKTS